MLRSVVAGTVMCGMLLPSRRVETTRHIVTITGLPPQSNELRLIQISDLHIGPLFREEAVRRVVSLSNACQPDLVVVTGDFVNYHSMRFLPEGAKALTDLHARLGVFACLGNHDHWEGAEQVQSTLEHVGVRVLVNVHVDVTDGLWLAAVDDMMAGQPDLARATDGLPDDAGVVLLSHNPTILPQVADRPWLVLAGHTHGGQIALPFLGPRGTIRLPGAGSFMRAYESLGVRLRGGRLEAVCTYRYPAGWYQEGCARMYVNRGVGFNQAWPVRINCPPEIACFTLRGGAG